MIWRATEQPGDAGQYVGAWAQVEVEHPTRSSHPLPHAAVPPGMFPGHPNTNLNVALSRAWIALAATVALPACATLDAPHVKPAASLTPPASSQPCGIRDDGLVTLSPSPSGAVAVFPDGETRRLLDLPVVTPACRVYESAPASHNAIAVAYCNNAPLWLVSSDRERYATSVTLTSREALESALTEAWVSGLAIPPGCEASPAASLALAEVERREAVPNAMARATSRLDCSSRIAGHISRVEAADDGAGTWIESARDLNGCPEYVLAVSATDLLYGEDDLEVRVQRWRDLGWASTRSLGTAWLDRQAADLLCRTGDISMVRLSWSHCSERQQQRALDEAADAYMDAIGARNVRAFPDLGAWEFDFTHDGIEARGSVYLTDFHPDFDDVRRSGGELVRDAASDSDSLRALCEAVPAWGELRAPVGTLERTALGREVEVTGAPDADCVRRFETGSNRQVTGELEWPSVDVYSGDRVDLIMEFRCTFSPVEMPSGTWWQLTRCDGPERGWK